MSKVQTDNSFFDTKVKLRLDNLPKKKDFSVLDCFCGNGLIWQRIQQLCPDRNIRVLGIDKKTTAGGLYLIGDNLKFLRALNLAVFDAIDLDAYGVPYKQLQYVLQADKSRERVIIYATFIQSLYGGLPEALLTDLGYNRAMVHKIPTLFYRYGFEKLKQYLAQNGVKKISYYSDSSDKKHYFAFELNSKADASGEYRIGRLPR